jgi:hypothetical protein
MRYSMLDNVASQILRVHPSTIAAERIIRLEYAQSGSFLLEKK